MSADNGVYILKTGRQYRVKPLSAIENLWYDGATGEYSSSIVPFNVLAEFGINSLYTNNAELAINIACNIRKNIGICEHGIVLLDAKMTWKQILDKAYAYGGIKSIK